MIVFERGANGRNELVVVGRTVPVWLLVHLLQEGVSERNLLETFTALVPENLEEARQLYECEGHRQLIDRQIRNHRGYADAMMTN